MLTANTKFGSYAECITFHMEMAAIEGQVLNEVEAEHRHEVLL